MNLTIEDAKRVEHALILRANAIANLGKQAKYASVRQRLERESAEYRRLATELSAIINAASGDIIPFDLE